MEMETKTLLHRAGRNWSVALEFKAADLWVGCFWRRVTDTAVDDGFEAWFCLVPTFPIHVWIAKKGGKE